MFLSLSSIFAEISGIKIQDTQSFPCNLIHWTSQTAWLKSLHTFSVWVMLHWVWFKSSAHMLSIQQVARQPLWSFKGGWSGAGVQGSCSLLNRLPSRTPDKGHLKVPHSFMHCLCLGFMPVSHPHSWQLVDVSPLPLNQGFQIEISGSKFSFQVPSACTHTLSTTWSW